MRYRRLSSETLETRQVLNGAPVLVQPVTEDRWQAFTSESRRTVEASHPEVEGYESLDGKLLADFNGDGIDDIFGQLENGTWGLHVNDGTELFLVPMGDAPGGDAQIIDTADFNNDGLLDVLSFDRGTGQLWVSINSLAEGFQSQPWGVLSPNANWLNVIVDDFDGDGWDDVLASESGGNWWLAKNVQSRFQNHHWARFAQQFNWQDVLPGDFTGDGITDVVARAGDNTWWLWESTTSKPNGATYWGHWRMRDAWKDVAVADFNTDGKADLIGRTGDGHVWVGSSTGDHFETRTWSTGWLDIAEWTDMQIVDMNGDGRPDQVGRAKDNTWWFAANTGSGFQNQFWQQSSGSGMISTNSSERRRPMCGTCSRASNADLLSDSLPKWK